MKKIPMFLSTLTVVGSLGVSALMPDVMAAEYIKDEGNASLLASVGEDIGYVYPMSVTPSTNQVAFRAVLKSGWYMKRVIVSGLDYENGFTTIDAEAGWQELGDERKDWELRFMDYEVDGPMNLWLSLKNGGMNANKTKVLYYAILVSDGSFDNKGNLTWGDQELWLRGKIDYRSCAGSSSFNTDTMYCENVEASQNDPVFAKYLISGGAAGVDDGEVKTWDQEWREIQEERLKEMGIEVNNLEQYLTMAKYKMDTAEAVLDGLLKTLPKAGWTDEATMNRVRQMKQTIEYLREYYGSLSTNNETDAKIAELEGQIRSLESEKSNLKEENDALKGKLVELDLQNRSMKKTLTEVQMKNDELEREIARLSAENESLRSAAGSCANQGGGEQGDDGKDSGNEEEDNVGSGVPGGVGNIDASTNGLGGVSSGVDSADGSMSDSILSNSASGAISSVPETVVASQGDGVAEKGESASERPLELNVTKSVENGEDLEGLEVPNLGMATQRTWWWLLIPLIGCLGALGMWLKRALFGAKTEY